MLASMTPIQSRTAAELAARMPTRAREDLLEWNPAETAPAFLERALSREIPVQDVLNPDPTVETTDDRPFNEYFLLRRWGIY